MIHMRLVTKEEKTFQEHKTPPERSLQCTSVTEDGVKYDENQTKASILNQYFSSVFTKHDNLQPPPDMGPSPYPEISNIEINCKSITCLPNELDPSKSHGSDDVLARLLAVEISPCLKLLFSASLHQGIIPQVWKQAIVKTLFKKGNRSNPSNYQPISLTYVHVLQDFRAHYSHQCHVALF